MKQLHFAYDMTIEYSAPVSNCNFTIKCIPVDTLRQKIENIKIDLCPSTGYQWGTDGFKNTQIWGKNDLPHTVFRFRIEGDAETGLSDCEETADTDLAMIFAYPHGLNTPGAKITEFYNSISKKRKNNTIKNTDPCTCDKSSDVITDEAASAVADRVARISQALFDAFCYQSGSTTVNTTAEEAFALGCGVCQDYAHILISLLQLAKIPARYVTGFIIGEGASHAWVEYLSEGKWYGFDPTHNKPVGDDYIKIAHGRDAKDCMINRGIMHGGGTHLQTVHVGVQEVRKGR